MLCDFSEPTDPYLKKLKEALGPLSWDQRTRVAHARERCVQSVEQMQHEQGCSFSVAARILGHGVSVETLRRWRKRYRTHGVWGLYDRQGRTTEHYSAHVHDYGLRTRRGRKAVSFVKWAGSKRTVMPSLLAALPVSYGRYVEPMVGSGTLFFSLPKRTQEGAYLSDTNRDLIETYQVVRDGVEPLIGLLKTYPNTQSFFLQLRALDTQRLDPVERAARFIYLNKTCFNGLYRVNKQGRFNVPYGHIPHAHVCDEHTLRQCSHALQDVCVEVADFGAVVDRVGKGDCVYFDPPYYRHHSNGHLFQKYQPQLFGFEEHVRLAEVAHVLKDRGCWVMLSNADTPEVRKWYEGWNVAVLHTRRAINAKASGREGFVELLVRNYGV